MPKPASTPKPKRFALNIVGALEDRPRVLRAYGRACGGEFALVMRPRERKAVLVHLTRQGGRLWRAGEIPPVDPAHARARAKVERRGDRPRLVVAEGPQAGIGFLPYEDLPASLAEGAVVLVEFDPNDQFAHVVATVAGDAPLLPFAPIDPKEAVALVKSFQKEIPDPGPTTLRGRWAGHLHCDDEKPVLRLSRRLAAYGTLEVHSALGAGWAWSFRRDAKWFASEGTDTGEGYAFLEEAMEAGILGAMRLVREACSFRDTRRRAAVDAPYAELHPIAQPREGKDPIERLKEPAPPKPRKPPKVAAPVQDGTPLPDAPATGPDLSRAADDVAREADALARLAALPWVHQDVADPEQIAEWFEDNGLYDAGRIVREYLADAARPADEVLDAVEHVVRAGGDSEDREEALAQVARLRVALESTPVLLERARKLVRYATAMVGSPACRGPEQAEAVDAAMRAAQVYETSREALARGEAADARRQVRMAAERVALSAAKVARSCARGQQSITARVGQDTEPAAPAASPEPKKKRGRKPRAAPTEPAAPVASGEVDPAKDKILLDAFSAAIAQAMGGGAA